MLSAGTCLADAPHHTNGTTPIRNHLHRRGNEPLAARLGRSPHPAAAVEQDHHALADCRKGPGGIEGLLEHNDQTADLDFPEHPLFWCSRDRCFRDNLGCHDWSYRDG